MHLPQSLRQCKATLHDCKKTVTKFVIYDSFTPQIYQYYEIYVNIFYEPQQLEETHEQTRTIN